MARRPELRLRNFRVKLIVFKFAYRRQIFSDLSSLSLQGAVDWCHTGMVLQVAILLLSLAEKFNYVEMAGYGCPVQCCVSVLVLQIYVCASLEQELDSLFVSVCTCHV